MCVPRTPSLGALKGFTIAPLPWAQGGHLVPPLRSWLKSEYKILVIPWNFAEVRLAL